MRIPMKKNSNATQKIQIDKVTKDANDSKGLKTNWDFLIVQKTKTQKLLAQFLILVKSDFPFFDEELWLYFYSLYLSANDE